MFEKVKTIMTSEELKTLVPVSAEIAKIKAERDRTVMDIIAGRDKRMLVIVGPCSADNETAVCDYVSRLAKLADEIKEKIFFHKCFRYKRLIGTVAEFQKSRHGSVRKVLNRIKSIVVREVVI